MVSMAAVSASMDSRALTTMRSAFLMSWSALAALSAFWRVMEAISSREEACSEASAARALLAEVIWPAAEVIIPEARLRPTMMRRTGLSVSLLKYRTAAP